MKKLLSKLSVRAKIMLLTTPLTISIIVATIVIVIRVQQTADSSKDIYYTKLYNINDNLLNADRDLYQMLMAATQYYNFRNGYTSVQGDKVNKLLEEKYNDYITNKQQFEERTQSAIEIASKDKELYTKTLSVTGDNFSELEEKLNKAYIEFSALWDVEKNTGDWSNYNDKFHNVRDSIDSMQEITEAWATDKDKVLQKSIQRTIKTTSIFFGLLTIFLFTLEVIVIHEIRTTLQRTQKNIDKVASGDLTVSFPEDSRISQDEIGSMTRSAKVLSNKLIDIMGTSNSISKKLTNSGSELATSASLASQASDQVTNAITDIAKGAVMQSENVRIALDNTKEMGSNIDTIVSNVNDMDNVSVKMKQACDESMNSLSKLIQQSGEVTAFVKEIGNTINSTNDSAKMISEFTQAITDISAQTNLLSLNASIEAARAGEAGRGFAVVADEIHQLADQSKVSADKIKVIVDKLLNDSESSVNVLRKLTDGFKAQTKQLEATQNTMEIMNKDVTVVRESSADVNSRVVLLDESKNELSDIINKLSSISEENAASTQETNASMQELNSTFTVIANSSKELQELAEEMSETISYFNI
ncbi:MAG: methyl-accepting chemotaxis protein [Lachnospiraceae bacterium]|nr:methyl-accepting chemotaxis protein [Lachnospiraceae bacterium]